MPLVQSLVTASPLSPSPSPRYFQKHPLSRRELSVNDIQLELSPILSNSSTIFGPSDPNFSNDTVLSIELSFQSDLQFLNYIAYSSPATGALVGVLRLLKGYS